MRTLLAATLMTLLHSAPARAESRLVMDGVVGPTFLMKSRSRAIGHAFKPAARLGLRFPIADRLEVGGAVSGVVDGSKHYRVLGGLAHGRFALWDRPRFSVGAGLGLGAGYDEIGRAHV